MELAFWQLSAGTVAAVFAVIAVAALIRLTQVSTVILVVSFVAIPIVALGIFAIAPRPVQDLDIFFIAAPFVGVAFAAVIANFVLRAREGASPAAASLHKRVPVFLVAWPCLVVAVSMFVYLFEPEMAVLNVAITAAWFIGWTPALTRGVDRASSYEIGAAPERVFAFITDPSNWPLYNPGVEAVKVEPPGPLAVGTRITFRQRLAHPGLRGPRLMMPNSVDITSEVTALESPRILATRRVDLPDSSDVIELSPVDGRTRVLGRVHNVVAYRYAVLGVRITSALNRRKQEAVVAERQARLKQLLEQP